MQCEMCGREGPLLRAKVEGIFLKVCQKCGKHGKVLGEINVSIKDEWGNKTQIKELPEEIIVPDYPKIIRNVRLKKKMTQEDFAKLISEKLSALQKMEAGTLNPSIKVARKLEKLLRISLIEVIKSEDFKVTSGSSKTESFTVEHFLKK